MKTILTRDDRASHFETIWRALAEYRDQLIPERDPTHDTEWDDIATAMARLEEDIA